MYLKINIAKKATIPKVVVQPSLPNAKNKKKKKRFLKLGTREFVFALVQTNKTVNNSSPERLFRLIR